MYVILLDCYDGKYGDDQYAVTASGSLAECRAITRHDENGRLIYEFEFESSGKNPTMRIAEDGTLVQTLKK